MVLALLMFVLTLGTILVSYWGLVLRPEARAASDLRARLQLRHAAAGGSSLVKPGGFDLTSAQASTWYGRNVVSHVADLLQRAGMRKNPSHVISGVAAGWLVLALFLLRPHFAFATAILIATVAPAGAYLYLRAVGQRRLNAFEESFPEAVDLIARALRAGHALTASLGMIAEEVPDPVGSEFRLLYDQQNYGLPVPQVLKAFADRMPLGDVRLFVTAVLTQRETGGNLAEILDNLASVTRDRFRVRRQLRVLTAQGRMTGWILAMFPLVLAGVLWIVNPSHMRAFLQDPLGVRMLQVAAALQVVGTVMIRRIVSVEY
jgi:tight adherence protein B